ncbi:cysteine hydrolase family protein [Halioxenophilus aromaticivorans]|uniref:Cysteine hydrolase n=1 Tax=Halioxenophilus aromaticivorans TaxID=1306992 RepID=A0AAV3U730_9ALTE
MSDSEQLPMVDLKPAWISPGRTALCVIDVQVDFASSEGLLGQYGIDMRGLEPCFDNINRLIASARSVDIPIIFIALKTQAATDSQAWKLWMQRQGRDADADSAICRQGEAGAEFYYCLPQPGDLIIEKARYSAFWQTDFSKLLQQQAIDTLVVTGITTECCVESTVRDAFHHDYHVFLPVDACAAYDDKMHTASLKAMAMNCALLSSTQAIEHAWSQP